MFAGLLSLAVTSRGAAERVESKVESRVRMVAAD